MSPVVSIIFVLSFNSVLSANDDLPKVTIASGELQGGVRRTQNNREYYYFTKVPYAKPPVGWYRFEVASPAKPWNGTLDATLPSPVCIQYEDNNFTNIIGEEDCLYLNVYTPQLPQEKDTLLPVMFYIGGEQYDFDDARQEKVGPELLLDKDVVLVTVNYRLGVFGFFVTEDTTVKYNNGLRDQVAALKWVKKNIDQFAGDPNRITVFGNGAGGASAHYHMLSPMSKDLISGVIAQSGTAFNLWSLMPVQVVGIHSRAVAGLSKCPTQDTNAVMVKCLKTVTAETILNATKVINGDFPVTIFTPVIERNNADGFLPDDPIDIVKNGEAADVPFLTGITTENGAPQAQEILNSNATLEKYNTEFEEVASWHLFYGMTSVVKNRIPTATKIRDYYFQEYSVNEATKKELTNMFTDAWYLEGLRLSTDLHSKFSKKPVYNYLFGYAGSETHLKKLASKKNGVSHQDELLYLFKNAKDFPDYEPNETDKKMTETLVTLWTNFATYGNPTPPEDTSLPFTWEPALENDKNFLSIKKNGNFQMQKNLLSKRSDFWLELVVDSRRQNVKDEL